MSNENKEPADVVDAAGWIRLAVRFPHDLYDRLDAEAKRTATPMAVIVRDSLTRELRRRVRSSTEGE